MTDGCAAGRTGETAVCDEGNVLVQTHACDSRGRRQHLTHTRAAGRAFVPDDNHIALDDLAAGDGCDGLFFAVEYLCRALVYQHLLGYGTALYHAAIRCQVALEDSNTAGFAVRLVDGADDVSVLVDTSLDVFRHGLSCNGHHVSVKQVLLGQLVQYRINAASLVQILHVCVTCRSQVADVRGACADLVDHIQVDLDAAFIGNCRQVEHAVGGAAQRHICGQCVLESVCGHDVTGTDVFAVHIHNCHTSLLCQLDALGVYCRNRAVALETHAQNLSQAVHGVCGVHTGAGTAGGAGIVLELLHILHGEFAGSIRADSFKHAGQTGLFALDVAGEHRAAADEYGRHVDSCSSHQQTGDILVTVRDHDQGIEVMRQCHALGGICDQVTGHQGILHALVSHGDAVTDCDRRENYRCAAGHGNAHFNGIDDLVDVHVSRYDLVVGRDDADQRPLHLFLGHSQCVEQGTLGCFVYTLTVKITAHFFHLI